MRTFSPLLFLLGSALGVLAQGIIPPPVGGGSTNPSGSLSIPTDIGGGTVPTGSMSSGLGGIMPSVTSSSSGGFAIPSGSFGGGGSSVPGGTGSGAEFLGGSSETSSVGSGSSNFGGSLGGGSTGMLGGSTGSSSGLGSMSGGSSVGIPTDGSGTGGSLGGGSGITGTGVSGPGSGSGISGFPVGTRGLDCWSCPTSAGNYTLTVESVQKNVLSCGYIEEEDSTDGFICYFDSESSALATDNVADCPATATDSCSDDEEQEKTERSYVPPQARRSAM